MKTTTYSHNRLQKAIGAISGQQLGFPQKHTGEIKPLPDTSAVIVDIKRIYPARRVVEFCFPPKNTEDDKHLGPHQAWVLVDHWYKEKTSSIDSMEQIKELTMGALTNSGLPLPSIKKETWPFHPPSGKPTDLTQILPLLTLLVPGLQGLAVTPLLTSTLTFLTGLKSVFPELDIANALILFGGKAADGLRQLSGIFQVVTQLEGEIVTELNSLITLKNNILETIESQIPANMDTTVLMDGTDAKRLELLIQGCGWHQLSDIELLELGAQIQKGVKPLEINFDIKLKIEENVDYNRITSMIQLGALTQLEAVQKLEDTTLLEFTNFQNLGKIKEETIHQWEEVELIYTGALTRLIEETGIIEVGVMDRISVLANIRPQAIENIVKCVNDSHEDFIVGLTRIAGEVDETLANMFQLVQLGMLTQLETEIINQLGIGLLLDSLGVPLKDYIKPEEPLQGVVIPLKGDSNCGYLFLGFIKI